MSQPDGPTDPLGMDDSFDLDGHSFPLLGRWAEEVAAVSGVQPSNAVCLSDAFAHPHFAKVPRPNSLPHDLEVCPDHFGPAGQLPRDTVLKI